MRRVVTGHDKNGKSIVVLDGPPARSIGEDVGGLFELWNTDGNIINTQDNIDRADDEIILSPPSNGSKFRYFQINPTPEGIPMDIMQDIAADAFEKIGAAHHRIDTTKHPAMHKTETIDYIILLKGDVTLILDQEEVDIKPFDVVVQRGTNHAWVNNGSDPALLIAVLIDSELN
ncbi:cupin domain-containing protein [Gammaproteobacteria bacterium]|nr:cupin domain-containing protein [Gammaproteobacteria bacterium]MDA7709855.1 cupin domain-containing protein [Gammaproteobacteria bacterium]MDA7800930.1 cupin domain-containing protein [Gammaproteobacteria bacterium]MDA8674482.1 cupin domain-containing protein [Gammaproteobacteria bacterium]MDA8808663.1 cupin domain-containing protein [Gammaproteobacteria bacterium]|tara:strand:- start:398 stop:919 length:522 start_codon:yes stop_codon:yes gene_type:complete